MDCKLQNKDQVYIIHISWEFNPNEALEKLQDLHKSGVIVYAKVCGFKNTIDVIPTIDMIMRFHKKKTILQIKKYFPDAYLEKISSWKKFKEKNIYL